MKYHYHHRFINGTKFATQLKTLTEAGLALVRQDQNGVTTSAIEQAAFP